MEISNSKNNYENYFEAYKSMISICEISKDKFTFDAFLINNKTIPNFIKINKNH